MHNTIIVLNELTLTKILSITCDNTSNNDTMVNKLSDVLEDFSGEMNRTQCFLHIVNLVAKTLI
ncbi:hypothetical protein BD769DRAFT_1345433 [Suillus cothurnatus]|nr:hypothetical protein BD769DRAFT_1345433 [Suillus cothurnatus]